MVNDESKDAEEGGYPLLFQESFNFKKLYQKMENG